MGSVIKNKFARAAALAPTLLPKIGRVLIKFATHVFKRLLADLSELPGNAEEVIMFIKSCFTKVLGKK